MGSRVKNIGEVFTPPEIVTKILDTAGYFGHNILRKHIIDNSCGDGAFLCEIARRYIRVMKYYDYTPSDIIESLETYIHGIELDQHNWEACIRNLCMVAHDAGVPGVMWDVRHTNALGCSEFNGGMDFVVGNPPYVRTKNLIIDPVKYGYRFVSKGMRDLYLAFFELGFRQLSPTGKLCYITPSSWMTSVAGKIMRQWVVQNDNLWRIIDYGHHQVFPGVTSYTMISLFDATPKDRILPQKIAYHRWCQDTNDLAWVGFLEMKDININGDFYLGTPEELRTLRRILTDKVPSRVTVKNGLCTNADGVFIGDDIPITDITIPVIKASTGRWTRCLFPYDASGNVLTEQYLKDRVPVAWNWFVAHRNTLEGATRDTGSPWYAFGRRQGIGDIGKRKCSMNFLIRDLDDIKFHLIPPGDGVYGMGCYILSDVPEIKLRSLVDTPDFVWFVTMLRQYKSGGYYRFSPKHLERYLNWKLKNQ